MIRMYYIILFFLIILNSGTRAESDTLYIVYTSNISGMIENCNCGKEPLGGMGRIKSYIDKIKNIKEHVIAIDGGDYFNTYPFIELNTALADVQHLVNYDVLLPGDQAFVEGLSFFRDLQKKNGQKWVISNFKDFPQKSRRFKIDSYEAEVFAFLSPGSFSFIPIPDEQQFLAYDQVFDHIHGKHDKNLHIVIVHGNEEEALRIGDSFPWIDLILVAHTQKMIIPTAGQTPVVGCGKDGEYVALIKIYKQNSEWKFETKFEKMNADVMEDINVLTIVQRLNKTLSEQQ